VGARRAVRGGRGTLHGVTGLRSVGLGWLPSQYVPVVKDWSAFGTRAVFRLELLFAAALAWWGNHGAWAQLRDLVCPSVTYEGELQHIAVEVRQTVRVSYRVWALTADGRTWDVPYRSVTDSLGFKRDLAAGRDIRVRYTRGTAFVAGLWVNERGP
jgi:hypothetical protein